MTMMWSELFNKETEPSDKDISFFVDTPLWDELNEYLKETYNVKPKLSYSGCAMDKSAWKGWNIKYIKSSKSLCTLYPKEGYFLALLTVSEKDIEEADAIIPSCCDYVKNLYNNTEVSKNYGKMIGIEVTSEEILQDMKKLIAIRVKPKK